jgi:hypothetical protein
MTGGPMIFSDGQGGYHYPAAQPTHGTTERNIDGVWVAREELARLIKRDLILERIEILEARKANAKRVEAKRGAIDSEDR